MLNERFILAIGRMERALSRMESYEPTQKTGNQNNDLLQRHETLKSEMRDAITAIDSIIDGKGN